ncbi:hypothetical protein LTR29_013465 [Friedmanniomyces endolithicus]|nr:hypothetical protein LTR94_011005 [Friedmanniomyces endolithicus]KAK0791113.1 hypothetical protein LTR59_009015 [Friedmanniomyces endolithicus]KAK0898431.1 hypothetical protein LTR57_021627 [Friedmanniomyces endolithicus]KAK0934968.1 hypothetical protein LTR29_013465 [Friedmanniomyces endolithicus]
MRLAVRQSLRLACNQRASSRSRVRHTGDAVVPPIRSFTSSARQTSDIRPPNGTPDQSTWQEHQHEQQRRAEDGVVEPDPERSTAKADLGDAKVAGESRKPLRRTLRQVPPARRTPEVPKPPPIPEWFLKHNVYLAKDTASDLGAREVLRCVDAATGHTLFTVPYYEPPELPTTTAVRGKDVDVSSLDLKKDVLSGLPDHLKEQMMIHHLQVQRAKRPEEISQEGLAELLVALPRDMQEEILRREAVEEKRTKLNERVEHVDAGPPRTKDTTKRTSKARNTLGQDFFAQKGPASQNPSLPTIGSTHNSATLKRLDDPEASRSMDLLVNQLAESVNADVIKFDANDFEDLLSEFVDGGRDTPGSFSNLGYDVFEGMQAHGVGSSQKNIFGNSHEEMEEDEDDDDDMEEDEDDDNSNDHSSGGVEFGTMDDLRKALQDKRGEFGKVLSGMGIAGITVGMPKMMAGFGGAPPPGMTAPRQSKIWREDEDGDVRYNVARLTALLDGLLDAGKLRRQSVPAGELGATDHGTGRVVGAHVERVSTAQMLASYIATSSVAAGEEGAMILQATPISPTFAKSVSPPSAQRTIVHVRDLKDVHRSDLGAKILQTLVQVVQKRRRGGESVMIVGTSAQDQGMPSGFMSSGQMRNKDGEFPFRTIIVPPLFKSSDEEIKWLESAVRPATENAKEGGMEGKGDEKIVAINLRHMHAMLSRLRPGQAIDFRASSTIQQMKLKGTMPILGERVLPLDQIQRVVLTAIGLAETHAQSDVVRPVHIALATVVTAHVDKLVQAWTTRDRMSKASKNFGMGSGGVGKEKNVSTEEAKPTKIDEVRSSCNHHETKLLTGVVDAKNIKTGFSDVHAPASTIEALKTLTSLSLLRPEAFTYGVLANDRLPGLLLYGPPGTGKTLLAKAVAKESKATVLEVTGAQIYEKYVGEGEKMVRAVFSLAKKLTPCVVFIDEADAIFGSRSGSGGGNRNTHREIINQFLREWDGMDDRGVFVMVASNRPFDLDDAVLRRLPRRVLVDLPAARDRESILGIHLKNEILDSGVQLAKLAAQTPLYSGSDLKNLCVAAALAAVREENELALSHAGEEGFKLPEKRTLMPSHFETAVKEISASISEDMSSLGAIRKFDEQFGDRKGRKKKAGYGFGAGGSGEEVVDERSVMVRVPDGPSVTPTPP